MLRAAGVVFEVVPPDVDEAAVKRGLASAPAAAIAATIAEHKARSVVVPATALVLGSDQTLELDGGLLSKPVSRDEALDQLGRMSGRTHYLHAAAVLVEGGELRWCKTQTCAMHMRPLSAAFVAAYLDAEYDEVRHSVGCYRLEGMGAQLFERVSGSHFAVLGLPLLPLLGELRRRAMLAS